MIALPASWALMPLGSVIAGLRTGPFGSAVHKHDYVSGGVPLINPMHINAGLIAPTPDMTVAPDKAAALQDFRLSAGDVIIARRGVMGRCATVKPEHSGWLIGTGAMALTSGPALEPDYLQRFISSPEVVAALEDNAVGTTMANLNQGVLLGLQLPVPPLNEQRRIVSKLDALTARTARARADLDRIPALAARYKQAVLARAFSGELTADWRATRTIERVGEVLDELREKRSIDRRLARRVVAHTVPDFDLPSGWCWISPDEVADDAPYSVGIGPFGSNLVQGDYRSSGVRLVFVRDIRREKFGPDDARYVTLAKAADLHQHTVMGGEVLITKMGEPPGDTAVYPEGSGLAVITADCVKLKPHPRLARARFLMFAIRADAVKQQLAEITAGVAQQKISLERFRGIAVPVPPLPEQDEIVRRIDHTFAEIDRLASEATSARRLLDRLDQANLAKAFRGELVVQDPTDEPASALLDRIRAERGDAPRPRRGRKAAA